jgi:eukaryotic-like serine/threonine-protein kinase
MEFDTLAVSAARLVDRVCEEFNSAWRDGGRPRIEDYLKGTSEPGRSSLLGALLGLELEIRRQIGEQPDRDEYLGRFPADAKLVSTTFGKDGPTATFGQLPDLAGVAGEGSIAPHVSRPPSSSSQFRGKRIWAWPLIAAVILAIAGFRVRATIERVMRNQMASKLLALRDADVEALKLLFGAHQAIASIAASDARVRALAQKLLAFRGRDSSALLRLPEQAELRDELGPWLGQYEYDGFRILDRQGHSLGSWRDATVGGPAGREEIECLDVVFGGRATVSRPRPSEVPLLDVDGKERVGLPTMFVLAPIKGDDGHVIAALGFRMRPEQTFTRVLNVARFGQSGETLAFDKAGLVLSESRFDDDLKRIGLIADAPHVRSTLSLELRDPGVDMTTGARPAQRRGEQPLTRLVTDAKEGRAGVDVEGDRDYRGVRVIGAWTWLPEYAFGVVTKVDRAEAYRPLAILQTAFWSLFALLAAAAAALFIFTLLLTRLRGRVRAAALVARQLGRYTLDGKIGEGGMGVVYRAHHAMLRRPTAVKLLRPDKTDEKAIARFEREVQLTSQLTHPNTITVYDYGRTSEGIFYYAMEYLDGIDLQTLVTEYGPQPDGRVIHILVQVCGSLVEAHGTGLIHRDIKPSNVILTRRGGLFDFVKLVDFGLVKALGPGEVTSLTSGGSIVGTPHYMAPEAIQQPALSDARSDLYAVGAVGYFLLTGQHLFDGRNVVEILFQHVTAQPKPPSDSCKNAISSELESLLLCCLAKEPANRPATAAALAEALGRIPSVTWSASDAEAWWQTHDSNTSAKARESSLGPPSSFRDIFRPDSTFVAGTAT